MTATGDFHHARPGAALAHRLRRLGKQQVRIRAAQAQDRNVDRVVLRPQIDILLTVVIGGMEAIDGAVIGSIVLVMAEYHPPNALCAISSAVSGAPLLPALFHPDRWLLWLGILFVLIVKFLPEGMAGRPSESQ